MYEAPFLQPASDYLAIHETLSRAALFRNDLQNAKENFSDPGPKGHVCP